MTINNVQFQYDGFIFISENLKDMLRIELRETMANICSNPFVPYLYPLLSLVKYRLSHPGLPKDNCPLFPGTFQYNRFLKISNKVIQENEDEFEKLEVQLGDLGAYSPRKGAITLVSSGYTVSASMSSICIRSCWCMGPVKDRHIYYEKTGDNFVGRTVTGISLLHKEFAVYLQILS